MIDPPSNKSPLSTRLALALAGLAAVAVVTGRWLPMASYPSASDGTKTVCPDSNCCVTRDDSMLDGAAARVRAVTFAEGARVVG